jgi:hypothetical protein
LDGKVIRKNHAARSFYEGQGENDVPWSCSNIIKPFSRRRIIAIKSGCLINRNGAFPAADNPASILPKMQQGGCSCAIDGDFYDTEVMALQLRLFFIISYNRYGRIDGCKCGTITMSPYIGELF